MPRLHALELTTDTAGDLAVRRAWQALRDAGLPSQLDHTGDTNTPHLTLLSAPTLGPSHEAAAVDLVGALLPITAQVSGIAVLGAQRVTIALLLDLTDEATGAVLALRATSSDTRHPGWLAHVTLARRVPRADLPRALEVLAHEDLTLTFTGLRRWDPEAGAVRVLRQV